MMVVHLVVFIFIPLAIGSFMSGRSLLLIFMGALVSQATVAVVFTLLSARDWSESLGMGALSLIFYIIMLSHDKNNQDD